jgi:hypothetical protein
VCEAPWLCCPSSRLALELLDEGLPQIRLSFTAVLLSSTMLLLPQYVPVAVRFYLHRSCPSHPSLSFVASPWSLLQTDCVHAVTRSCLLLICCAKLRLAEPQYVVV